MVKKIGMTVLYPNSRSELENPALGVTQSCPRAKGPRAGLGPPRAGFSNHDRYWGIGMSQSSDIRCCLGNNFATLNTTTPANLGGRYSYLHIIVPLPNGTF